MKMLLGILLCVISTTSYARDHTWMLHDFSFRLPAGFSRIHASDAFQLINKDGVGVTVDALPKDKQMSPNQLIKKWSIYAETQLPQIAKRHGTISTPLTKHILPSGDILYSLEESTKSDNQKPGFGLLFVLISPKGRIAQLVFEGPGDPDTAMVTYRPYVVSAKWLTEPNNSFKRTRVPRAAYLKR